MLNPNELKQRLSYLILGRRGGYNRIHIIEALKAKPSNINQLSSALQLNYRTVKHHIDALLKHEIISTSRIGGYGEVYFISPDLEGNMPMLDEIVKKLTTISTSPRFFQSLIEQTNDAVIIFDDQLEVLFWNKSAEALYGLKKDQVLGKRISVFKDLSSLKKIIKTIQEGKRVARFQTEARHCDGQDLLVNVTIEGIKDEKNALIGYSLIAADVTERNRIMEALRLSEERYALAQRAAGIISWEWDPKTDLFTWSDQFGSFMGLNPGQLGGTFKEFLTLIHPDDKVMAERTIRASLRRKSGYSMEHRIIKPNRGVRWVLENGGAVPVERGKAIRVLGIVQDITERKRQQRQTSYQSKLLDNVSDAIIATDEQFNITYWTHGAEGIYGWASEEVMGKPLRSVVQSKFKGTTRKNVMDKLIEDGRFDGDVAHRRKDGSHILVESETIALKDDAGSIIGFMSLNRDVSERRKVEEKRKKALDRMTQLSIKVSWTLDELEAILSPLPEPIVIFDIEGKIITANKAVFELFGYSAQELAGRRPAMIHPEDRGKVQAALALTAAQRKPTEVVARVVTKSGVTKDFAHSLAPVIRNDEVWSIVGIIREPVQTSIESVR